jgi:hypothetical protein
MAGGIVGRLAGAMLVLALGTGGGVAQEAVQHARPKIDPARAAADALDFSVLMDPAPEVTRARAAVSAPDTLAAVPITVGSRTDQADGSVQVSAGEQLPTPWDAKAGVDLAAPAPPVNVAVPGQSGEDHGSGWANLAVPATPLGIDKATIEGRIDPAADQGRLSTALSRSMPIGGGLSLTLQNGYAVTQSLANPTGLAATTNPRVFSGDGGLRLDFPTATALSADARMSSTDDRPTPSLAAEQKLFDSPFSIKGSISALPSGETDRSITAGFKRTW